VSRYNCDSASIQQSTFFNYSKGYGSTPCWDTIGVDCGEKARGTGGLDAAAFHTYDLDPFVLDENYFDRVLEKYEEPSS
jgi:hypothetical protein